MDELKIMNLLAADRGISLTSEERAAMDRQQPSILASAAVGD